MTFTFSAYQNSRDTKGVDVSLGAVAKRIRTGARGLDEKTKMCHTLAQTAPEAYRDYKAKALPAVTFAGTFPKGKRQAAELLQHSGLVVLDIDDLSEPDIPLLLSELLQLQQVKLAFVSPSGLGIKIVVSVSPVPTNDAEHKTAWQACVDFFESLSDEYGFEIDPSGKDVSRLCFLAYMETQGVSESTAYRKTKAPRKQRTVDTDAKLRMSAEVLLAENGSQTKTAKVLGISRGKLRRILGI